MYLCDNLLELIISFNVGLDVNEEGTCSNLCEVSRQWNRCFWQRHVWAAAVADIDAAAAQRVSGSTKSGRRVLTMPVRFEINFTRLTCQMRTVVSLDQRLEKGTTVSCWKNSVTSSHRDYESQRLDSIASAYKACLYYLSKEANLVELGMDEGNLNDLLSDPETSSSDPSDPSGSSNEEVTANDLGSNSVNATLIDTTDTRRGAVMLTPEDARHLAEVLQQPSMGETETGAEVPDAIETEGAKQHSKLLCRHIYKAAFPSVALTNLISSQARSLVSLSINLSPLGMISALHETHNVKAFYLNSLEALEVIDPLLTRMFITPVLKRFRVWPLQRLSEDGASVTSLRAFLAECSDTLESIDLSFQIEYGSGDDSNSFYSISNEHVATVAARKRKMDKRAQPSRQDGEPFFENLKTLTASIQALRLMVTSWCMKPLTANTAVISSWTCAMQQQPAVWQGGRGVNDATLRSQHTRALAQLIVDSWDQLESITIRACQSPLLVDTQQWCSAVDKIRGNGINKDIIRLETMRVTECARDADHQAPQTVGRSSLTGVLHHEASGSWILTRTG
eukprot:GHVN01096631.1.p1 GENE.GHVN01096631.1~~GHVN01096631.1.p1  ORF type:complete len:565 (+),score=34.41 GHVN01096631.1:2292-3986(+)